MSKDKSPEIIVAVGSAAGLVGSIKDLATAAKTLGFSVEKSSNLGITKDSVAVANGILTVTSKGIVISAEYIDSLLKKSTLTENITAADINNRVGQFTSLLTTIQSILSTALAGVDLNALLKSGTSDTITIVKSALNVVTETLKMTISSVGSVSKFADTIASMGMNLENVKGLESISSVLQGVNGLNFKTGTAVLSGVSGIIGGVSAGLVIGSPSASTEKKIVAGVEMTSKIIGNFTKTLTQIMVAQRLAAGMSVTAPVIGLIASSVSLAISPLSFYNVAKKFEYADEILKVAEKFKTYGYTGDELLASFHKETATVEASITTVSTTLGAISAGVGAAASGSLVGAPVALIVGAVAGIITAILDASKQGIINSIANKYWHKINEWQEAHPGENYFDYGYDSRYSAFMNDNIQMLHELADEMGTKSLVTVTQQGWDSMLGDLAALTGMGDKISSGKVYTSVISDGHLDKDATEIVMDNRQGNITLDSKSSSQALVFLTPLMSATSESRVRVQTGKNSWLSLTLGKTKDWVVTDKGNTSTVADFSKVVQKIVFRDSSIHDVTLTANMGNGNDTVFIGQGESVIDAGKGFDTVSYSRSSSLWSEIKAIDGESGNYDVKRRISGEVYHEIISTQTNHIGKNTEKIEYRDVTLKKGIYNVYDKLRSVEQIIGSKGHDLFYGGEQTDYFFGGEGDDIIHGAGGNDYLYGDAGNDVIWGEDGDDLLSGGTGNDSLYGGAGNDIYLYSRGDGHDRITESQGTNDFIFLNGINSSELTFKRNNNNDSLELTVKNSTDAITFNNWFLYDRLKGTNFENQKNTKIESIMTSDGKLITSEKVDSLIEAMSTLSFSVSEVEENKIFDTSLDNLFAANSVI